MGIEFCIYKQVKKRGAGTTLRMGEACEPCRSDVVNKPFKRRTDIRFFLSPPDSHQSEEEGK